MSSRPWMPLYVADYLGDTGHLSTLEHGAYLLLIMHYWQAGGLPEDEAKLRRIARLSVKDWCDVRDTISELFEEGWRHKRVDLELSKAAEMLIKRSAAGKMGAAARYADRIANAKQTHAIAMAKVDQTDSIVRVRNNYNHIEPSLQGQSVSPREEEATGMEQASAEASLAPSSALLGTKLMRRTR